jgi:2-phosphosulfolactate phosphatase
VLEVRIHRDLDAVENITGTVVVIDVFRASNTIIALLEAGASDVLLLADLEAARAIKAGHPGWRLLGERGGIAPGDFDGGNSPANAHRAVRRGETAILTTSAGTQAVGRLAGADAVLFGSFANVSALVEAVTMVGAGSVTLLPMGFEARLPAVEDDEAARYIAGALDGRVPDYDPVRGRLLACDGADRLRRLGQDDDLAWCTTLDTHRVVPVVEAGNPPRAVALGSGGIGYNPGTPPGSDRLCGGVSGSEPAED